MSDDPMKDAWDPVSEIPGMAEALQSVPLGEWTHVLGRWVYVLERPEGSSRR